MMMVRSKAVAVVAACVLGTLLGPAAVAGRSGIGRTSIAKPRPDGTVLEIATGTGEGRCSSRGELIVCEDGARSVRATLADGCLEAVGGAHCEILAPNAPPSDQPPIIVPAGGSGIDVECQKGAKAGNIYTLTDGDGTGACEYVQDVDKRVIGGTCAKNNAQCTGVNCERGCEGAGAGCECHLKSARRQAQATQ
jgi:hypothetical protein